MEEQKSPLYQQHGSKPTAQIYCLTDSSTKAISTKGTVATVKLISAGGIGIRLKTPSKREVDDFSLKRTRTLTQTLKITRNNG